MTQINPYTGANWPAEFQGCRINGHFVKFDGTPMTNGKIQVTPNVQAILAPISAFVIVPTAFIITLDSNGQIRGTAGNSSDPLGLILPATNDADTTPNQWTYTFTEQWAGGRTYSINAPQNTTIDLSQVIPVFLASGTPATIFNVFSTNGVNVMVLDYGAAVPTNPPANTLIYQKTH